MEFKNRVKKTTLSGKDWFYVLCCSFKGLQAVWEPQRWRAEWLLTARCTRTHHASS